MGQNPRTENTQLAREHYVHIYQFLATTSHLGTIIANILLIISVPKLLQPANKRDNAKFARCLSGLILAAVQSHGIKS